MNLKTIYFNNSLDKNIGTNNNIIMMIYINGLEETKEILEIISSSINLNSIIKNINGEEVVVFISGNVESYKTIFRRIDINNSIARKLLDELHNCSWPLYFNDFIEAGIMDIERFRLVQDEREVTHPFELENTDKAFIHNIDPIDIIKYEINMELKALFGEGITIDYSDLIHLCMVNIEYTIRYDPDFQPDESSKHVEHFTYYSFFKFIRDNSDSDIEDLKLLVEEFTIAMDKYSESMKDFAGDHNQYLLYVTNKYNLGEIEYNLDNFVKDFGNSTDLEKLYQEQNLLDD